MIETKSNANNSIELNQPVQNELKTPSPYINAFSFLRKKTNSYFKYQFAHQSMMSKDIHQYFLKICIILPDDSLQTSKRLQDTINNLYLSITGLQEVGLSEKNILICLFLQNITQEDTAQSLFDIPIGKINSHSESDNEYHMIQMQCESELNFPIDIILNYKQYCKPVESIACFFNGFVFEKESSPKRNEKHYMMIIECGAIFNEKKIRNLILATQKSNDPNNKSIASVPSIETISSGLFSRIQHYEQFHYNIYDLHYFALACTVPVNSKFCVIVINHGLYDYINKFYKEIQFDASLGYHDYALGVYLKKLGYEILYVPYIEIFIDKKDITFSEVLDEYSERNQANFAEAFSLLSFLFQCSNCTGRQPLNHFIVFFQLIGILTDFVFPSLMIEVMYTIFFEGFGITDYRASTFFAAFYMLIIVLTIFYSIIQPKAINFAVGYFILFIFFEVYYLFILICSIVAMDNVNKNTINDPYKFNTAAIVILILFNVIFGIMPMILNINKLFHKIGDMFIYFFLASANYSSLFLMHSIFNANEAHGSLVSNGKKRKCYILLAFVFSNAFFGFLIFAMSNRTNRVNCVLALAITYTIYNFFKMLAIVLHRKFFKVSLTDEIACEKVLKHIREEKEQEQKRYLPVNAANSNSPEGNHIGVLDSDGYLKKEEPYQDGEYASDSIKLDVDPNTKGVDINEYDSNEEKNSNTSSMDNNNNNNYKH